MGIYIHTRVYQMDRVLQLMPTLKKRMLVWIFFGTTDHDYWPQDMSIKNWELTNSVANSFNEDGVFTSLVGFEWTSDEADYGHELGRNHGKVLWS